MTPAPLPFIIPKGCPQPKLWPPPPTWWEVVVVAFSGGVDSHAALLLAIERYGRERILVVYNDTGDEHSADNRLLKGFAGIRAFVVAECAALGVPLVITEGQTILDLTSRRRRWADSRNRYCTSATKRDQSNRILRNLILEMVSQRGKWAGPRVRLCTDRLKSRPTDRILRSLVVEAGESRSSSTYRERVNLNPARPSARQRRQASPLSLRRACSFSSGGGVYRFHLVRRRPARRILLITGELAAESRARARRQPYELRKSATAPRKGRLVVWHRPMLAWQKAEEIRYIWSRGREIAPTYAIGNGRCSCRFCFYLPFSGQVLNFVAYPEVAAAFVRLEDEIGHKVSLSYEHTRANGQVVTGYRAVGEFVYGDRWDGRVRPPMLRAWRVVEGLRNEAERNLARLRAGGDVNFDNPHTCAASA